MGWNHFLVVVLIFNILPKISLSDDNTDITEETEESEKPIKPEVPEKQDKPEKSEKPKKPDEEVKTITIVEDDNGNKRTTTITGSMKTVTTTKYGCNRCSIFNPFSWFRPRSNRIQIE